MDTSAQVRDRLSRELGQAVPPDVWRYLDEQSYVEDAQVADGADGFEALKAAASLVLAGRAMRPQPPGNRLARLGRRAPAIKEDVARAWAISEFVAALAARRPQVRAFRRDALGGAVLTRDEALSFLASPAARMFSLVKFTERDVPPARHTARLTSERLVGPSARPKACEYRATVEVATGKWPFRARGLLAAVWDPARRLPEGVHFLRVHLYTSEKRDQASPAEVLCWPGSVLDDVRRLADVLAERYAWDAPGAAGFLLTGQAPFVPVISADLVARSAPPHVALRVQPWLSGRSLMRYHQALQRALGIRERRPPSERNLRVMRFVCGVVAQSGERPPWRSLVDAWNRRHPLTRYGDVRLFWRDYRRAERAVIPELFGAAVLGRSHTEEEATP